MSANFLYVLYGVLELTLSETLALGTLSVLLQYLWRSRTQWRLLNASFNVATIAIAILLTHDAVRWSWWGNSTSELAFRIIAAASVYFLANSLPISFAIALTEDKRPLVVWRECYVWSFGYYLVGATFAGVLHLYGSRAGWQVAVLVAPLVYLVFRSYNLYVGRLRVETQHAETQLKHAEELAALQLRTIEALALAIEARDEATHDHLRRVQQYCLEIGKLVGLATEELRALEAAALLHDIGKLAVPEHILSKPGRLTPEEFEKVKIHPVVGAEILERVQFPYPVVPIVRHHHEQWDGTGYPDGLAGDEIPIGARILSVVDAFDALSSDRQYRRAMPVDEVVDSIAAEAGKRYDPNLVELLRRHHVELEEKVHAGAGGAHPPRERTVNRKAQPAAGFETSGIERSDPAFLTSIGAARAESRLLMELTEQLTSSLTLSAMVTPLCERLQETIPNRCLVIYLLDGEELRTAFAFGERADSYGGVGMRLGEGLSGWVAATGKPVLNGSPALEPQQGTPPPFEGLHSTVAVPLEGSRGLLGVLCLYSGEVNAFNRDHLRVLSSVSSRLGLAIENSIRYQKIANQATLDYLTQLPNAGALFEFLRASTAECRRASTPLSVLVCDLDHFKQVNDALGHLAGNQVLRLTADVLRSHCRKDDYAARLGGDEFVIVLPGVSAAQAGMLATRLRETVRTETSYLPAELGFSISVGSASMPEDGDSPEELLAEADRKMYEAKQTGKAAESDVASLARSLSPAGVATGRAPEVPT